MTQDLRQIIRSILLEELSGHGVGAAGRRPPAARQEFVRIQSDADLARFVERLMRMAGDSRSRAEIESGHLVFRLEHADSGEASPERHGDNRHRAATRAEGFSTGLITESRIHQLPDDVRVVTLGKNVVLTPLAKDAIRQAGIKIERAKT